MKLTAGQATVLQAFSEFGHATDAALATYIHHISQHDMSSSGVRSRRVELLRKQLVERVDARKMKSGRHAGVYSITRYGRDVLKRSLKAAA